MDAHAMALLLQERKTTVDEFMAVLVELRYPTTTLDRALVETFWMFLIAKKLGWTREELDGQA